MPLHVTALARYPIKGCRGQAADAVTIDHLGVVGDRRLMLVDAGGTFLSQRELPALATIAPALHNGVLEVTAPTGAPLMISITADGPLRPIQLWRDEIWAVDQGTEAASWFSEAVGQPCRLVWFGPGSERLLDPRYSPRSDAQTAFSDGYPVLGVLEESLAALNQHLDVPVPMNRFRPNLMVTGGAPWSEASWESLTVGEVHFDAVKPCARCQVITTDQSTGARDPHQEPLRTLAALRTTPGLGAIFGQNLVPRGPGIVRVGDPLHLHSAGPS